MIARGAITMTTTFPWKPITALLFVSGATTAGAVYPAPRDPGITPPTASEPASVSTTTVVQLALESKADSRPPLTNVGIEEGEGDAPRAWSQGAAIPGVEYIWSRDAAHG